jgi:hypothetical protein
VSNIVVLPDSAHIAYHNRLHAIRVKRGDQSGCALVLDILDLVFDLLQLPLLGGNQLFTTAGAFLPPAIDVAIQFGLEFVAILHFGAQQSPIENVGSLAIVGHSQMDFSQIDARNAAHRKWGRGTRLSIGGNGFVLRARPVNDYGLRQSPGPVEN